LLIYGVNIESFAAGCLSSLVDLDHFIQAGSHRLEVRPQTPYLPQVELSTAVDIQDQICEIISDPAPNLAAGIGKAKFL
jgi:hypothetical protein